MRVALIHATPASMAPIENAFAKLWPEAAAKLQHLLDGSLSKDVAAAGSLGPSFDRRMLDLCAYALGTGSEAVLFTCSAFGRSIEACQAAHPGVAVLKPNEAMMVEALELAEAHAAAAAAASPTAGSSDAAVPPPCRIGVLATFEPTIASITAEIGALAAARGSGGGGGGGGIGGGSGGNGGTDAPPLFALECRHVPSAMEALLGGDQPSHDRLVAAAAAAMLDGGGGGGAGGGRAPQVLLLAQYSMACAAPAVQAALREAGCAEVQVLTSPESAVRALKARTQQYA